MKRKRFPSEQIVSILRQAELGMAVSDIVRQLGISGNPPIFRAS
jgi:putative transposase